MEITAVAAIYGASVKYRRLSRASQGKRASRGPSCFPGMRTETVSFSEALKDAERALNTKDLVEPPDPLETRSDGTYLMNGNQDPAADLESPCSVTFDVQAVTLPRAHSGRSESNLGEIVITLVFIASLLLGGAWAAAAAF
jgi:hypothetical protein